MDKQTIEVILIKEEIIHAVQTDIHRFERTHKLETPILIDNDTDRYNICRLIDDAVNDAVRAMQAYLMVPSSFAHRIANNHTEDWKEKSIRLGMPTNWPPHLLEPLKNAIQKYSIRKTEVQLLSETAPNDPFVIQCDKWAEEQYNEIESIISDRIGPIKVHTTLFG